MLPPKLSSLKNQLEAKGYAGRSTSEDELLVELRFLDRNLTSRSLNERLEEFKRSPTIVSGPSGSCPCCGK